jgi:sterol desaturase/sphingolipid hydroxylase (fatty acid hydroxylase superfamily)
MIGADAIQAWIPWAAAVWFGLLFAAERLRPLRRQTQRAASRWGLNAAAVALALGTSGLAVIPLTAAALNWSQRTGFGLLHSAGLPAPAAFAAAILLLDLSFYYWHRLNHALPILWRFHNVHHIDPDLDTTTAFRFHFGEIALSAGFRGIQIVLIGPGMSAYAAYQALFVAGTVFHHSNLRLPASLERALNRAIVTPRMHGIHHSAIRDETNSNYSTVFRWWDSLHRSLRLNVSQDSIHIGVAGYTRQRDNSIRSILWLPFMRQRAYWKTPDGRDARTRPNRPESDRTRLEL